MFGHKMVIVSNLLNLVLLMCAVLLYQIKNPLLYVSHLRCSLNPSRRLDKIGIDLTCVMIPGGVLKQFTEKGSYVVHDNKTTADVKDKHDKN